MSRRLAALAVLALLVAVPGALAAGVRTATSISPQPTLFGDVIHATITVRGSAAATVQPGFAPFQVLHASSTSTTTGGVVVTTWRFDLQCLDAICAPGPGPRRVSLTRSRVRVGTTAIAVAFPPVLVDTRATKQQVAHPERAFLHPTVPPPPSYRFSPTALRTALALAAMLLALLAIALLVPLRRGESPDAAGEPLDPLARALALVRASLSRSPPDRRRALGLLARTLRRADEPRVAQVASDLAWSEPEPEPERIVQLADRIDGAS